MTDPDDDEAVHPEFGSISRSAAALVQQATSGGPRSAELHVRYEDEEAADPILRKVSTVEFARGILKDIEDTTAMDPLVAVTVLAITVNRLIAEVEALTPPKRDEAHVLTRFAVSPDEHSIAIRSYPGDSWFMAEFDRIKGRFRSDIPDGWTYFVPATSHDLLAERLGEVRDLFDEASSSLAHLLRKYGHIEG